MRLQTPTEIDSALAHIAHWQHNAHTISRTYAFADFVNAIDFVRAVADLAEKYQHHPDIDIRWNRVTLSLTTHDLGGLTEMDFEVAKQCDALASQRA